jgi:type I restriction enzyme R subunit
LQELIQLARDIRTARQRGEEEGLSSEEIAFYDALAENESAVEEMGDDSLKVIAHELLQDLPPTIPRPTPPSDSAIRPPAHVSDATVSRLLCEE